MVRRDRREATNEAGIMEMLEGKALVAFEAGQTGTADQFRLKNTETKELIERNSGSRFVGSYVDVQVKLQEGAIHAFKQDRPGNVQTMLADPEEFRTSRDHNEGFVARTLLKLMEGSANPVADVKRALEELPEQKQHDLLDIALLYVVGRGRKGVSSIDTLLEAGANPNADIEGRGAGWILARAIAAHRPDVVIERLQKKGANSDDAISVLQSADVFSYGRVADVRRLRDLQLRQTVRELTERLTLVEAVQRSCPSCSKHAGPAGP